MIGKSYNCSCIRKPFHRFTRSIIPLLTKCEGTLDVQIFLNHYLFVVLKLLRLQTLQKFYKKDIVTFCFNVSYQNYHENKNKVRRVDRRTNALPNRPNNRPIDGHSHL